MSEEKFRDLYENAPSAYFSVGTDSIIRNCNKRAEELIGYTKQEMIGRSMFELYSNAPDGKAVSEEFFKRLMVGKAANDVELKIKRSDNTDVWVSISKNTVVDEDGGIVESRFMIIDISDRKRVEEKRVRFIGEMKEIISEVKKLSGLLPICSNCKRIRDDEGDWKQIEQYISEHFKVEFTHSICPDCVNKYYSGHVKDYK
jgi:PAS domain S-box-containing protein